MLLILRTFRFVFKCSNEFSAKNLMLCCCCGSRISLKLPEYFLFSLELVEFVRRIKPKQVFPIVVDGKASGFLSQRSDFIKARSDLSSLKQFLSTDPMPEIQVPDFVHLPTFRHPRYDCKHSRLDEKSLHKF